jgi:hypothetical protein
MSKTYTTNFNRDTAGTAAHEPFDWKQCKPEYVSLFEYLGKPAGTQLGTQIRKTALVHGIKVNQRMVRTVRYTGNVALYPKAWLDAWFKLYQPIEKSNS